MKDRETGLLSLLFENQEFTYVKSQWRESWYIGWKQQWFEIHFGLISMCSVFGVRCSYVSEWEGDRLSAYIETLIRDIEIDETSQTECRYRASIALD